MAGKFQAGFIFLYSGINSVLMSEQIFLYVNSCVVSFFLLQFFVSIL